TLEDANNFDWCHVGYNLIPFDIMNGDDCSFVMICKNEENGYQRRTIEIVDFDFDGSKLPTEKEISSYELPKELVIKSPSLMEND
ncbi:MAG: hypothetical protein K2I70_04320, partial [Bacilli bacterium]|nr:hypothetical protein [Bacilli bacterium]